MRITSLWSASALGVSASACLAASITVNNPSFEDAGAGVPSWGSTGGTDRGAYAPFVPTTFNSIPDGSKVAYLYNAGARIYQVTSEPLTAGKVYTLSAYFGERNDTFQPRTIMTILPESEVADFTGADPFGGSTDHLSFVQVEPSDVASKEFKQFSTTFDTTLPGNAAFVSQYAGQNLVVTFYAAGNGETDLDLVSFTASDVPEPTTLALTPVAMLLLRRRNR